MFTWINHLFTKKKEVPVRRAPLYVKNSLSGSRELFIPRKLDMVRMYSCGPTVYGPAHVGNLRAYVFSDTLARTLLSLGYRIKRVINITDVGHLVGDGDNGEDKMTVAATRMRETPKAIADRNTKLFLEDIDELNVDTDAIEFPRATDYIREQIALAKTLLDILEAIPLVRKWAKTL